MKRIVLVTLMLAGAVSAMSVFSPSVVSAEPVEDRIDGDVCRDWSGERRQRTVTLADGS